MPSAPGPGARSALSMQVGSSVGVADLSVNMESPMLTVEENVRALRVWQADGEKLVRDMTHSLGELSQRMASAESECSRLREGAEDDGSDSQRPAKLARGADGGRITHGAAQLQQGLTVAGTALRRSEGELLALGHCVRGVIKPEACLLSDSCFLRGRVQELQEQLATLRKSANQASQFYQLLSIKDARCVLFDHHFVNLGLPTLCRLAKVSVQFRLWVREAFAKLPVVVALGGCDEEAKDGWSDGDLKSLEILQFVPLLPLQGDGSFDAQPSAHEAELPGWKSARPDMPEPRGNPAACTLPGGSLFVAGGEKGHHELDTVSVYNAASDLWMTDWPKMAKARGMARACFIPPSPGDEVGKGSVLMMGGTTSTTTVGAQAEGHVQHHGMLDYAVPGGGGPDALAAAAAAPHVHHFLAGPAPAAAMMPGAHQVFGAVGAGDDSDDDAHVDELVTGTTVESFDIATRTWSEQTPMPHARRAFAADVLLDGRVIVAGGATFEDEFLDSVVVFNPASADGARPGRWEPVKSLPAKRCSCSGNVLANGMFVIAGGYSDDPPLSSNDGGVPGYPSGGWLTSCLLYDPEKNTWKDLPSMSTPRADHATAAVGNSLFVIGGINKPNQGGLKVVEFLDCHADEPKWYTLPPLRTQRWALSAVSLPPQAAAPLLLYGGAALADRYGGDRAIPATAGTARSSPGMQRAAADSAGGATARSEPQTIEEYSDLE
jgi:hypothetical protein